MEIQKKILCDLDHCYAVSVMGEKQNIFFASEANGPCIGFDKQGEDAFTVWNLPGGTMGMVEIPEGNGDFLAVQNFLPVFQAEHALLVWVHKNADNSFVVAPFVDIPYVHRFDLLRQDNVTYLLVCTLCTSKQHVEDWSDPGKVYVGVMPSCADDGIVLEVLLEGLTHNHGYCSGMMDGKTTALIGSDEGLFAIYPPQNSGGKWSTKKLLQNPVGDVAMVDIDGDGAVEIATIEPFHGTNLVVYHKGADGYKPSYHHPQKMEFGHSIWGGYLLGTASILCGCRAGKMGLFCLQKAPNGYDTQWIDEGAGPSNLAVLHRDDADVICAANRQAGQAVLYLLSPEDRRV